MPLDCGNSGTTMRLLAGALAGRPFERRSSATHRSAGGPCGACRSLSPRSERRIAVTEPDGTAPVTVGRRGRPQQARI